MLAINPNTETDLFTRIQNVEDYVYPVGIDMARKILSNSGALLVTGMDPYLHRMYVTKSLATITTLGDSGYDVIALAATTAVDSHGVTWSVSDVLTYELGIIRANLGDTFLAQCGLIIAVPAAINLSALLKTVLNLMCDTPDDILLMRRTLWGRGINDMGATVPIIDALLTALDLFIGGSPMPPLPPRPKAPAPVRDVGGGHGGGGGGGW